MNNLSLKGFGYIEISSSENSSVDRVSQETKISQPELLAFAKLDVKLTVIAPVVLEASK
jgi:hypothetical protein